MDRQLSTQRLQFGNASLGPEMRGGEPAFVSFQTIRQPGTKGARVVRTWDFARLAWLSVCRPASTRRLEETPNMQLRPFVFFG